VNQSLLNIFQTVRFLADAFNLVNLDVSPLQQSSGLPVARIAKCISAFKLRPPKSAVTCLSWSLCSARISSNLFW
jgi:hypothetical protein